MFQVQPVDKSTIDAWTIAESGLPVRVVNSMKSAGVTRLGELRTWSDIELLKLRSLGRISLDHIHQFLEICTQVSEGRKTFANLEEVFRIFLDDDELFVLAARYGFSRPDLAASRNYHTLQRIGNEGNRTRERVRQVEEVAKRKLQSKLSRVCLKPFIDYFMELIQGNGKSLSCTDLGRIVHEPGLGGFNPCSILLLIGDLGISRVHFYNEFFTVLPVETVRAIEGPALDALQEIPGLANLQTITDRTGAVNALSGVENSEGSLRVILNHHPDVASTADNRFFLYEKGMSAFVLEIMRGLSLPAHYRTITAQVNDRLIPRCRKGAGFVLKTLNGDPHCKRVERGIYTLR